MEFKNLKVVVAVAYVILVGAVGAIVGVSSNIAWVLLAGLALLPAIAMLALWNDPEPTMSESIARARR
jgi:hypothetical protein